MPMVYSKYILIDELVLLTIILVFVRSVNNNYSFITERQKAKAAGNPSADQQGFPDEDDDITAEGDNPVVDETGVLDSLTGLPVDEDTLLYAIPFCAPYSALQNFK